eukprot:3442799-Rhodomonas_salina.1
MQLRLTLVLILTRHAVAGPAKPAGAAEAACSVEAACLSMAVVHAASTLIHVHAAPLRLHSSTVPCLAYAHRPCRRDVTARTGRAARLLARRR